MKLRCSKCGHGETVNKRFFLKVIDAGLTGTGYWVWVAYLFAGTGFAMPICIAIMSGGVASASFSDDIAKWVSSRFACPDCCSYDRHVEE